MTTFNEYRKKQEELRENTLYTDPASKQAFMDDEKAMMSAFMYNFLGMVFGYNLVKNKKKATTYFRSDLKLQLNNITDDNNNMSLIIKLLEEKGAFKSSTTAAQITRFLVKLKQNSIDEVDSEILIGWINGIKDNWWSKLGSFLRVIKEEFVLDKDQYKAFMSLRVRARIQQDVAKDFFETFKGLSIDDAKMTKWSPDLLSQKSINKRLANIGGLGSAITAQPDKLVPTAAAPEPVAPVVNPEPVVTKPKKVEKQEWPGSTAVAEYFINGGTYDNFNKVFKSSSEERRGSIPALLQFVFTNDTTEPTADKLNELAKFIINNSSAKILAQRIGNVLESNIRSNKNYEHHLKRVIVAQEIGILFNAAEYLSSSGFKYVMTTMIQSLCQNIIEFKNTTRLKEVKELTSKIDSNYQYRLSYSNAMVKFVADYLRSPTVDQFIKFSSGDIKLVNGVNTVTYTKDEHSFDYDNAVIKSIMTEYHLEKQSNDTVIAAYMASASTQYGWGYDLNRLIDRTFGSAPYSADALKSISDQFIKGINDGQSVARRIAIVKSLFSFFAYNDAVVTDALIKKMTEVIIADGPSASSDTLLDVVEYSMGSSDNRKFDKFHTALFAALLATDVLLNNVLRKIRNARGSSTVAMPNFVRVIRDNSSLRARAAEKFIASALDISSLDSYYNSVLDHISSRNNMWDILTADQQTKLLNDIVMKLSISLDNIRSKSEVESALKKVSGNNTFTYKMLDKKAKDAYKFLNSKMGSLALADDMFFNDIDDEVLQRMSFNSLNGTIDRIDDTDHKADIYTRFFAKPENKASFTNSDQYGSLITMMKVNEHADIFTNDIDNSINNVFAYIRKAKRHYDSTDVLKSITNNDYKKLTQAQKDAIFTNTLSLVDDPEWIKKQTTAFKDKVPDVQEYFDNMVDTDRAKAQKIYDTMTFNMRLRMAESYLTKAGFSASVEGMLHDESPIAPYEKLDKKRIKEILKYNNVSSAETKIPAKFIKSFDTMDEYIQNVKDNQYNMNKLEGQKVELLDVPQEELDKIAVDLHRTKRNGRHGDVTMKILRSFKVSIPVQETEQKAWIEANPNQEIINPMFHGTGSIGASMILRYGFRVIKSGDSLVVGRMLGDGIYGSNIIDKAQQYVGDKGFSRATGTKGYVFKMNAALGEKGKDYRVAGVGGDSIRSPEWCVFTPNAQFKIYQAYEVQLIPGHEMEALLKKYPQSVNEKSFKDYLNEKIEEKVNYTTYTFITGVIPGGKNPEDAVDFSEWKSPSKNITLEPSAYGPTVVVAGTDESNDYIFTSIADFRTRLPEEYEKFISYFK